MSCMTSTMPEKRTLVLLLLVGYEAIWDPIEFLRRRAGSDSPRSTGEAASTTSSPSSSPSRGTALVLRFRRLAHNPHFSELYWQLLCPPVERPVCG
jgi:hypothetical protein